MSSLWHSTFGSNIPPPPEDRDLNNRRRMSAASEGAHRPRRADRLPIVADLQVAKTTIERALKAYENVPYQTDSTEAKLRKTIQHAPFLGIKGEYIHIIKPSLEKLSVYGERLSIPEDIILDTRSFLKRLEAKDLDTSLVRGIAANNRSINAHYQEEHMANSGVLGHNGLEVGDWWPLQVCAVRDGAHGEYEAGISGTNELGATSVVISGGSEYKDIDNGDEVLYCGTILKQPSSQIEMTRGTRLLMTSETNGTPVRLLRGERANVKSAFAPRYGLRYDGLYRVENHEVLDWEFASYRFTLRRLLDQPKMRHEGPGSKPSADEIKWVQKRRAERHSVLHFIA